MTRAVLGDAIALIRGDRYYTTDFSREFLSVHLWQDLNVSDTAAAILTTWGFQDTQRDPNNGGFGGECKNDKILKLIVYWRSSWYSAQAFDASSPSSLSFRKLFVIDSRLNIYLTTGLTELGLRLLSLLHSPENEGKLDQTKDRWSIHVHSPRAYPNPKGTEHIHRDQVCLQRPYSIPHRVRHVRSWQWLRFYARVWSSCQVRLLMICF